MKANKLNNAKMIALAALAALSMLTSACKKTDTFIHNNGCNGSSSGIIDGCGYDDVAQVTCSMGGGEIINGVCQ